MNKSNFDLKDGLSIAELEQRSELSVVATQGQLDDPDKCIIIFKCF